MKKNTFSILFVLKKGKTARNGESPVNARITINGVRIETSTHLKTDPALWNSRLGKSTGRDKLSAELNKRLDVIRVRLMQAYRKLELDGKQPTAREVVDTYLGRDPSPVRTVIGLFREHNEKCRQLSGIDMAPATVKRYETALRHTQEYIRQNYGAEDIEITKADRRFVTGYEFYLKTVRRCNHNSTMKYLKNFRKIINLALAEKYITDDPFTGIKLTVHEVERDFLEEHELAALQAKHFPMERLNHIRDIFLFCCYTGLAFSDVQGVTRLHLCTDNDGAQWIRKSRQKTKHMCNIPLLEEARRILAKYKDCPESRNGALLPVPTNQKMNAYLKEIATVCGITKQLTTHTARHTFATTVCLANGVSMENVAKMLGHSDTKMTRHYARVLDRSIMNDMKLVQQKLAKVK